MQNVPPHYNKDNYDAKKRYKDILQIKALLFLIVTVIVINFFPYVKKFVLALSNDYDSVTTGSSLTAAMWQNLDNDFVDVDECSANEYLKKNVANNGWDCVTASAIVSAVGGGNANCTIYENPSKNIAGANYLLYFYPNNYNHFTSTQHFCKDASFKGGTILGFTKTTNIDRARWHVDATNWDTLNSHYYISEIMCCK